MFYKDVPIPKPPYYKPREFMKKLAPVQLYGIPKEFDSRRNPKAKGTVAHERFWYEELYKIVNGFWIGEIFIPGFFYYYMNYKYMKTINGVIMPDMVDLYLELSYFLDWLYESKEYNGLFPKARRRGISEVSQTFMDFKWRFTQAFQGGVAAGLKTYTDDFISKWLFGSTSLPIELQVQASGAHLGTDEIVRIYEEKNQNGVFETKGLMNTIYSRTMKTNPNMFKGLYLNLVISEEIGEHENWFSFFNATKDALMSNNVKKGVFLGYGTAGNVNKGSKDFKKLSQEAEKYKFIEMLILGQRRYYYGGSKLPESDLPMGSELFLTHTPSQLIGVEDLKLAEVDILKKRAELLRSGDKKEYVEHLQNNPINKSEMFKKSNVNDFDMEKMNNQAHKLEFETPIPKYGKYILEWETNKDGVRVTPLKVKVRTALPNEDEWKVVYILHSEHPRKGTKAMYTAGIDSYDQDTSTTSKSLGAMCVRIRMNNIGDAKRRAPVALIRNRPPRKEIFYENCLKLAVYYGIIGNCLLDIRNPGIISYWRLFSGEKYLAGRPAKFESPNTQAGNEFGWSLNAHTKPIMCSVMQTDIYDNIHENEFPMIVNELQDYDVIEVDSDNDAADAYGLSIIQDLTCEVRPKSDVDVKEDRFDIPDYVMDNEGNLVQADGREKIPEDRRYGNEDEFDYD